MTRSPIPRPLSRVTGLLVLAVGAADLFLAAVLFADQLVDIVSDGVVASVMFDERAGEQAAALWFAVKGALLVIVGQLARARQDSGFTLPATPGWVLIAVGALGALVAPVSGFWVYIALGVLWVSDSRRESLPKLRGRS